MSIALNIIFAAIVFIGVVGPLAFSIVASRTVRERKVHPVTARNRSVARQRSQRAYGSFSTGTARGS